MQLKHFDINTLSIKEADDLSIKIGNEVRDICDKASIEINAILSVYGMSAKIAIAFNELSSEKMEQPKKKRGKPRKVL